MSEEYNDVCEEEYVEEKQQRMNGLNPCVGWVGVGDGVD